MILCTISQFHCTQAITLDMIDNYQLDEQEVAFLQLVYAYHHRENDNQLWHMIAEYEQIFYNINATRLVILKILQYQPNVKALSVDSHRLQNLPELKQPLYPNLKSTTPNKQTKKPTPKTGIDPILQFLSGNI
ncbi:hypothetical protein ACGTJS_01580 [Faucicola mancuniensis]|uniref:hypothetical protein n=1 Tax=Faucicola mancuniensis TaxID=1309795 RepID=UPI0039778FCD